MTTKGRLVVAKTATIVPEAGEQRALPTATANSRNSCICVRSHLQIKDSLLLNLAREMSRLSKLLCVPFGRIPSLEAPAPVRPFSFIAEPTCTFKKKKKMAKTLLN